MLMCCVCVFSLHRESPDMILGDKSLIFEVDLSQRWHSDWCKRQPRIRWGNVGVAQAVMEALAQNAANHPILYGAVDLEQQPWVGCTSRSWHEYDGSMTFSFSEYSYFEFKIFALLTLRVLTWFQFSFSRKWWPKRSHQQFLDLSITN
jgi:hypothetical protein